MSVGCDDCRFIGTKECETLCSRVAEGVTLLSLGKGDERSGGGIINLPKQNEKLHYNHLKNKHD